MLLISCSCLKIKKYFILINNSDPIWNFGIRVTW